MENCTTIAEYFSFQVCEDEESCPNNTEILARLQAEATLHCDQTRLFETPGSCAVPPLEILLCQAENKSCWTTGQL